MESLAVSASSLKPNIRMLELRECCSLMLIRSSRASMRLSAALARSSRSLTLKTRASNLVFRVVIPWRTSRRIDIKLASSFVILQVERGGEWGREGRSGYRNRFLKTKR